MSYDCSKTLDYAKGLLKMCETLDGDCKSCPLYSIDCGAESITQEHIDAVQAWNDEHKERTNAEMLREVFPDTDVFDLCPDRFIRHTDFCECDNTIDCYECKQDFWKAPYSTGDK